MTATIVVFGAGGRLGRRVVSEAASRGHDVIGMVRRVTSAELPDGVEMVEGDATSLGSVRPLAESADVLVSAVGGVDKSLYLQVATTLVAAVQERGDSAPRIIHSGGGGSLLDGAGTRFVDTPGFPEAIRAEVLGQAAALDYYRVGGDHPVMDAEGGFGISYEDYAVTLVDEIERPRHLQERFTVGY